MPRKLDLTMLIIDLESTCWEPLESKPPNEWQDIIEIGITTLDLRTDTPTVGEKRSILVFPSRSAVSPFCQELTTLTQDLLVREGLNLEAALTILKSEYRSRDRAWASWGDFDRKLFDRQCQDFRLQYPFGPRHLNLKCLFSVMHHLDYELGMAAALDRLGIPLEGTHHRGGDDAHNIAKIAARMFTKTY